MAKGIITMRLQGQTAAAAPCTGDITCGTPAQKNSQAIQIGTAGQEYDAVLAIAPTLAASGSITIDWNDSGLEDPIGDQFAPVEIAAMHCRNLGPGTVELQQNTGLNPWSALWGTAGVTDDAYIRLPAGCAILVDGLADGAYPVIAGDKEFNIVEIDAVGADVELQAWGRRS